LLVESLEIFQDQEQDFFFLSASRLETKSRALHHCNLWSCSWLAWANDTAAHCAAIHCPC